MAPIDPLDVSLARLSRFIPLVTLRMSLIQPPLTIDPGLWYAGGSLAHARFLSRYIALQVKADLIGTPLSVYQKTTGEARL